MYNLDKLLYTYKHRKVIFYLANKYKMPKEFIDNLVKHDMDKMYLLLFYEKKLIEGVHRSLCSHHDNDIEKSKYDYMEMVLDWESARYTKDDKPLNAYDTLINYYPHLEKEILPILKELNIDKSTLDKDDDVVCYVKTLDNISEEDIKKELIEFINNY